eukprot:Pgem_evm1s8583
MEIVSSVLSGNAGFEQLNRVLKTLHECGDVQINKSMGLHVHVGALQMSVAELKMLCFSFCKFEEVFDQLIPDSRRGDLQHYCKSNVSHIGSNYRD